MFFIQLLIIQLYGHYLTLFTVSLKKYCSSQLTQKKAIEELFSNTTWSLGETEDSDVPAATLKHWNGAFGNIYITLVFFIIIKVSVTVLTKFCVVSL